MSLLPVRETLAGKHVMVTGVTGFVGKVWLAMLLDFVPDVRRVTVLGRGKKGQDAAQRFEQIYRSSPVFRPLRERLGQGLYDLMDEKVLVLDAKLSAPLCGFDPWQARELMADVDVVVHFAGLTDFEPDPQMAIDANQRALEAQIQTRAAEGALGESDAVQAFLYDIIRAVSTPRTRAIIADTPHDPARPRRARRRRPAAGRPR